MNKSEIILGYAKYNNVEYPFAYEDGVLNLLPPTKEEWGNQQMRLFKNLNELSKSLPSHVWVEDKYLEGITSKGKNIIFIADGAGSNYNGFLNFNIKIIYEYEQDYPNGKDIGGLKVRADEIDYFINPARVFKSDLRFSSNNKLESIYVKTSNDLNINIKAGKYDSSGTKVDIGVLAYPGYHNRSSKPLVAESEIYFEFDNPVSLEKTLGIIYEIESFLRYISYRKNINIRSIDTIRLNKDKMREKDGRIIVRNRYFPETNKKKTEEIISLELLEEKISLIFQDIADEKVYTSHFCDNLTNKKSYNIARIILIFAAFESEYKNFSSVTSLRSQAYFDTKKEVVKLINDYKEDCSSRGKGYVDSFIRSIDFNDNILSACIKDAIETNIDVIEIFIKRDYKECNKKIINKISQRLSSMRNHIAHGNLNFEIDPFHISDLKILESLNYVMRLNSMKISKESIQKSICKLIGYNIMIKDNANK